MPLRGMAHERQGLQPSPVGAAGAGSTAPGTVTPAGALLALALVWVSGAIMAHPLPTGADHHLLHCEHPGEFPATHLFCFPQALRVEGDRCPHARPS